MSPFWATVCDHVQGKVAITDICVIPQMHSFKYKNNYQFTFLTEKKSHYKPWALSRCCLCMCNVKLVIGIFAPSSDVLF